ncbi:type II secretion system F family protein [Haloarcula montana]|uniref:type II secretion system F family protein n=1 Tax=Haloarcula montana TaxID=3111776 RepID=UPI002D796D3D|nr:type II secretion system F family protein [Haloarcula sp. GH36]
MALNPLGLAPLAGLLFIAGLVVLSVTNESVDRRMTRYARRVFGRYVSESEERKRQLEAAYIGQSYRSYAARTLLFTGLSAIGGALAGAYLFGGLLLALPTIVDLMMGLPRTMVNALGIRGFELVLQPQQTLVVLVAGGVFSGIAAAAVTYTMRWELPKSDGEVRARSIDEGMARTIAFMYALSRGGMSFPEVMGVLARNEAIYGEAAREIGVAVRQMDLFGRDMITALRHVSHRTPSETFKTFSENLSSVLQSGQSLSSFLHEQHQRHHEEAAERQSELLERLATIAEAYVTLFVAGVLFLITILLVFGLTTTDTLWILQLLAYLIIPLANAGFMVYLAQKLDALGIGGTGSSSVLNQYDTSTFGQPSKTAYPSKLADGGVTGSVGDNLARLRTYDKFKSIKRTVRSPLESLLWNPGRVLYIAVPVAIVLFAVRVPAAFQTSAVNVRLLDDLVIQSLLLVFGSFAIVRYSYTQRIQRIENATPELLERLASLNEAGMTIVESLRRLRGSDIGVLTPEVDRIWADIKMGANVDDALVRFGRRIRTTAITRVVTLLTNAMHSSGQLGPVLRIASKQARADTRLRKRRRQQMFTYLVVIYISFLVFLVIIVSVQEVLVPALPSNIATPDSSRLGVNADQFARFGRVDKAAYTLVFFHTAIIQAVLTGFIGGQLGEGTLKDGAKHAAILLGIAYVAFLLLSSPVASLTVDQPTATGGELTVDSVSLSSGGFVVVHALEADGEVIGTSRYLEPGTHKDVTIQLSRTPDANRDIVLVPHRDTDGNEQLGYQFEGPPGETDAPYPASGQDEFVTVTIQLGS